MSHTCRSQPSMSRGHAALLLTLALAATNTIAAQQGAKNGNGHRSVAATVDQPRPFGYVVGDLVTQRVLLTSEPAELPPAQRVSIWFERRASKIEVAADGRRWLVVEYQLINAPQELTTVRLPAWVIEDKAHGVQLAIPAAPISVSPLISDDSVAEIQPDREVSIIDTAPARVSLIAWAVALSVTLVAWLAWWQLRNWRDSHNRPFARALHELRRIDEMSPEAWQALHRAFDQTAGRVLQTETLPALFDRAPYLQPQRADIECFFAQSNERFFGAGSPSNLLSVRALCHALRRIERRHAP
jgi:mxaA protein